MSRWRAAKDSRVLAALQRIGWSVKREAKGASRIGLVLNRVREGQEDQLRASAESLGLEVMGLIPEDENITRHDLSGQPLFELAEDSPAMLAVRELVEKLQLTA